MTNTAETKSSNSALPKGEISGVNGPVVDVAFQKDSLPRIREAGWKSAPPVRRFRFPSEMPFSEGFSMFSGNALTAENRCLPKRNEEAFTDLPRPMPKDRQPKKFLKPVLRLSTCLLLMQKAEKSAFSAVRVSVKQF